MMGGVAAVGVEAARVGMEDWCELHCHTPFSLLGGGSAIEALVARAKALGMHALAVTDTMTLAGVVRFHNACHDTGLRPITGCELLVRHDGITSHLPAGGREEDEEPDAIGTILALARDRTGYANLCGLLSDANLADPRRPLISLADLSAQRDGLILLARGCDGLVQQLLLADDISGARAVLAHYRDLLGPDDLYLEVRHELLPESTQPLMHSARLATEIGLRCVACNGARYAVAGDMPVFDVLTCVHHGLRIEQSHPARPRNAERHLKSADELRLLFSRLPPQALDNATVVAAACRLELLAARCEPPAVPLPAGETPAEHLRALCEAVLPVRYPTLAKARRHLDHELDVICRMELEEFFLVVHDILIEARWRRIRCAGRGSAANSIVAYLLDITGVDPIRHHLLFERFLIPSGQVCQILMWMWPPRAAKSSLSGCSNGTGLTMRRWSQMSSPIASGSLCVTWQRRLASPLIWWINSLAGCRISARQAIWRLTPTSWPRWLRATRTGRSAPRGYPRCSPLRRGWMAFRDT